VDRLLGDRGGFRVEVHDRDHDHRQLRGGVLVHEADHVARLLHGQVLGMKTWSATPWRAAAFWASRAVACW
jgi:hypothetical protein